MTEIELHGGQCAVVSAKFMPEEVQEKIRLNNDNFVTMLELVMQGVSICLASERLRDNADFVMSAITRTNRTGPEFHFASPRLKADREVAQAAIEHGLTHIEGLPEHHRDDLELMTLAFTDGIVSSSSFPLVSERLRDNKEFAALALTRDGELIRFVSDRLKDDEDLARIALKNTHDRDTQTLKHLSERLQNDRDIIRYAVKCNGYILVGLPKVLRDDRELNELAVQSSYEYYRKAPAHFKADKKIAELAFQTSGKNLAFAPGEMQNDKELVMVAINQTGIAYSHASDRLKNDFEVVLAAFAQDINRIGFATKEMQEFLEPYKGKRDIIQAIETAIEIERKHKVKIPLAIPLTETKARFDLVEALEKNLTKKLDEPKRSRPRYKL